MKAKFTELMNSMDLEGIKEAMLRTWNEPCGEIFREVGFDIIEDRFGEEVSDRVYSELWTIAH